MLRVTTVAFCALISLLIVLNSASRLLQNSNPSLALTLNPLNVQALLKNVGGLIKPAEDGKIDKANVAEANRLLRRGIGLSPKEAELFSVSGFVAKDLMDDTPSGDALYAHALQLNRTEPLALVQGLRHSVSNGDNAAAAEIVGIMVRRWEIHWPLIEPYLPILLNDAAVFPSLADDIAQAPLGKYLTIESLLKLETGPSVAAKLLIHWYGQGNERLGRNTRRVVQTLFESGQITSAYLLFRSMLPDVAKTRVGYIYNEDFRWDSSGSYFDWIFLPQQGFDLSMELPAGVAAEPSPEGLPPSRQLTFRFQGKPIKMANATQFLLLPPGDYSIAVEYEAAKLETPKPVKVGLRCRETTGPFFSITFKQGNVEPVNTIDGFSVPVRGCRSQILYFRADNVLSLQKNRYRGVLRVNKVSISKMTGGS